MSELAKTLVYVSVAVVCLIASVVVVRSNSVDFSEESINDLKQPFFPRFTDPLVAARLEIVKWDESAGQPREFEIRKDADGKWTIPSRYNYPTDLRDQLAQAATSLIGLIKENSVSDDAADHASYKVVDPREAKVGDTGVGTFVRMADQSNNTLAELIIGEPFPGEPDLRYVAVPKFDRVYVAKVDTSKLSTNFKDWINKDLLQLNTGQIDHVVLHDYSIDPTKNPPYIGGDVIKVTYNATAPPAEQWSLADLPAGKELDRKKLNDMLQAFGQLQIVDVRAKPTALGRGLSGQEGLQLSQQLVEGLAARGYYIIPVPEGGIQLLSKQGEINIALRNGVEYVLRFGEKAQDLGSDVSEVNPADPNNSRYLLIVARFNEQELPRPTYQDLPAEPGDPAGESAPATDPTQPRFSIINLEEIKSQGLKTAADYQALREEIEKQNALVRERYQRQVEQGQKLAQELNDRFSGWFYIINDELFEKIHLDRAELLVEAGSQPEEPATPAMRPGQGGFPPGFQLPPNFRPPGGS